MIVAIDVGYNDKKSTALAAMVVFQDWTDERAMPVQMEMDSIAPYESGAFYKRELPCIVQLINTLNGNIPKFIIVDGYVDLEPGHIGLGKHVFNRFKEAIPVIGVAKTRYLNSQAIEICRGESKSPLFITAVGIDVKIAAEYILKMHGPFRIPTLLKEVDRLSRKEI